jgi:adenine-specific DNA-methyltransferase
LIWWGKKGLNRVPSFKRHLSTVAEEGTVSQTVWLWSDIGHTQDGRKEQLALMRAEPFGTPKPEKLIARILEIGSGSGELVLDSFLGSGTTTAVAGKLGRRWIGVETGRHAETHCAPRLRKVIDGEQGGISESVGWTGGGGFRFYRLGEAVFADDGRINPAVRFPQLAAHVWFSEFGAPFDGDATTPWLGDDGMRGLALLFNGILGDKSPGGGNVLTTTRLAIIRKASGGYEGPITVYGEASRLGPERLQAERVTFKQTPYDVRAR